MAEYHCKKISLLSNSRQAVMKLHVRVYRKVSMWHRTIVPFMYITVKLFDLGLLQFHLQNWREERRAYPQKVSPVEARWAKGITKGKEPLIIDGVRWNCWKELQRGLGWFLLFVLEWVLFCFDLRCIGLAGWSYSAAKELELREIEQLYMDWQLC